jgi:hypothetical protein
MTSKGMECHRCHLKGLKFTLSARPGVTIWTFTDGVSVNEELRNVDISKLRAVCNQQSRSRWTTIASRDRLYQFIAMSDEQTQDEMRLKALSMIDMNSAPSASLFDVPGPGTSSSGSGLDTTRTKVSKR